MRLVLALLLLAAPLAADPAREALAAEIEALALTGPPLGQNRLTNFMTVFGNGFGGSLTLNGCAVEIMRRDVGTADDTVLEAATFPLNAADLTAATIGTERGATTLTLPMIPPTTAHQRQLDTSASAALTDRSLGALSYVTREVPAVTLRLEDTRDPARATALLTALTTYQTRHCPP